ncbi:MAG: MgtC/SapB family protein [Psychroflexus halocasei]
MEVTEYILRLSTAFVLGGIIGFERQWHQKNAGLRTNTLVAIGAASFVLLSVNLHELTAEIRVELQHKLSLGLGL